jgi:hypothetical protein
LTTLSATSNDEANTVTVRLRAGLRPADAAARLLDVANGARNIGWAAAGRTFATHQNDYLSWVRAAKIQLGNVFTDPNAWEELSGTAYWAIQGATESSARPIELVNDEVERQAARLEAMAEALTRLADRAAAGPGTPAVLDTHVLLHFQPVEQVNWSEVIGEPQVRLDIPLRVIEELDEKKYTARDELADRARGVLSHLRSVMSATAGAPTSLRTGLTIEVPIDDGPRSRGVDADQEILDTCRDLRAAGPAAYLVTDDTGLTLRAQAAGLLVVAMPERYLRRRPVPSSSQ